MGRLPGTRRQLSKVQSGRRPGPGRSVQRSPLARSMKGKAGSRACTIELERADGAQIGQRRLVAREEEMVAVVDPAAELLIRIGAAAAAGRVGRLVEDDVATRLRQAHRGREPGEAGADHVGPGLRCHQSRPCRTASQSLEAVGTRTRRAGSRHASAIRRSSRRR